MAGAGQLYRMSDYQSKKNTRRQERRRQQPKQPAKQPTSTSSTGCGSCGSKKHSSKLFERRESCLAFAETCATCHTVGHFKAMCRGRPKSKERRPSTRAQLAEAKETKESDKTSTTPEGELGLLTDTWFLLSGNQSWGSVSPLKTNRKVEPQSYINSMWTSSKLEDHGQITLVLWLCTGVAKSQGFYEPKQTTQTRVSGLAECV